MSNISIAKDYSKSIKTTAAWKSQRYKFLQGMKKFNKSTAGKRLHRSLARTLATRIQSAPGKTLRIDTKQPREARDLYKTVSSIVTHILIDEYYGDIDSMSESIDAYIFETYAIQTLSGIQHKLMTEEELNEDDIELLLRLCNEQSMKTAMNTTGITMESVTKSDDTLALSRSVVVPEGDMK